MSHWHLPPKLVFLTAACLAFASGSAPSASAADSSLGPVSEAESAILWKDSQTYYARENCQDALSRLKRLVDRYPGYPTASDYRKARFELGHCYYELNRDKEAIQTLKTYLEGAGDHPDAERARELMGLAQLRSKQLREAYLTSTELQKSETLETQAKALLLRAKVWIARNNNEKAKASNVSALALADQTHSNPLLAEARLTEFEIATRDCALPSLKKPAKKQAKELKEESKVRTEIETRGTCLNEALVSFRKVLTPEYSSSADHAVTLAAQAFEDYRHACQNPPNPPHLTPKDRTSDQLKNYKAELVDELTHIYEGHRKAALQMITNWKHETPPPSDFVQRRLQKLEESLQ